MARKPRDHAAEYAAAKRRATRAGYTSQREYKKVRKELNLPPRTMPVPKRVLELNPITRLRRESQKWSDEHSHRYNSRYRKTLTDAEVEAYHAAFPGQADLIAAGLDGEQLDREIRRRIHHYLVNVAKLVKWTDWDTNPSTVPLRR